MKKGREMSPALLFLIARPTENRFAPFRRFTLFLAVALFFGRAAD